MPPRRPHFQNSQKTLNLSAAAAHWLDARSVLIRADAAPWCSHTTIFAKDAVGLERALHRHFASVRVNLINLRREYFYATPAEVREALVHLHGDYEAQLLEFHETADAPEYVASEDLRSKGTIPQPANLA